MSNDKITTTTTNRERERKRKRHFLSARNGNSSFLCIEGFEEFKFFIFRFSVFPLKIR